MKKIWIIPLLLIPVGIAFLGLFILFGDNARAQTPRSPKVINGMQNMTLEPSKNSPLPENATQVPEQPAKNAISQDDLMAELGDYKLKAQENFPSGQTGWFYSSVSEDGAAGGGSMPNGDVIPAQYTTESWYYVDESGMVTRSITLMKALDGRVFQAAASQDGKGWNSVFGEEPITQLYPLTDLLDWAYADIEANARSTPAAMQKYADHVEISFVEEYLQPLQLLGMDQEIVKSESRYFIDTETGLVTKYEVLSTFVDGTQRVTMSHSERPLSAVAQPSAEALAYFEELSAQRPENFAGG